MLCEHLPAARSLQAAGTYTENKHPRHPKGSPKGGEFASKTAARDAAARSYIPTAEQVHQQLDAEAFEAAGKLSNAADAFYSGDCTLEQLKKAYDKLVNAVLVRGEARAAS